MANYLNSDGLSYFYSKLQTKFKPDWLENDNTSTKYISNRTHYQEKITGDISTINFIFTPNSSGYMSIIRHNAGEVTGLQEFVRKVELYKSQSSLDNFYYPSLYEGETYTVTINGTSYSAQAWACDKHQSSSTYNRCSALGDARKSASLPAGSKPSQTIIDQYTNDLPFLIYIYSTKVTTSYNGQMPPQISNIYFVMEQANTEYTIQISGPYLNYFKLDRNYLDGILPIKGNGTNSSIINAGLDYLTDLYANRYAADGESSTAINLSKATGDNALSTGFNTIASGNDSFSAGRYTEANHRSQFVFGMYNILDDSIAESTAKGNYIQIVGNGTSDSARSNAYTLDWSGNGWYSGTVSAGTTQQPASVINNNDLTTKAYVDNAISSSIEPETDEDVIAMLEYFGLQYEELEEAINESTYTDESVLNSLQSQE